MEFWIGIRERVSKEINRNKPTCKKVVWREMFFKKYGEMFTHCCGYVSFSINFYPSGHHFIYQSFAVLGLLFNLSILYTSGRLNKPYIQKIISNFINYL